MYCSAAVEFIHSFMLFIAQLTKEFILSFMLFIVQSTNIGHVLH